MNKLILPVFIIILLVIIGKCFYDSDTKPKEKKRFIEKLADGTTCEFFNVEYEMEFVATSRILNPEEYQKAAALFHFPKTKMVYFHLDTLREKGEQYGTLYSDLAIPVPHFNPDSLISIRKNTN